MLGLCIGQKMMSLNIHLSKKGNVAIIVLLSDYKCLIFQILLVSGLPIELVDFFHDENNMFICYEEKNELLN